MKLSLITSAWPDLFLVNQNAPSTAFLFVMCVYVCCRVVTPGPRQRHGDAANDGAPLPAAPGPLPLPAETAQPQTPRPWAPARPQARRAPPTSRQHPGTNAARVHRSGQPHQNYTIDCINLLKSLWRLTLTGPISSVAQQFPNNCKVNNKSAQVTFATQDNVACVRKFKRS